MRRDNNRLKQWKGDWTGTAPPESGEAVFLSTEGPLALERDFVTGGNGTMGPRRWSICSDYCDPKCACGESERGAYCSGLCLSQNSLSLREACFDQRHIVIKPNRIGELEQLFLQQFRFNGLPPIVAAFGTPRTPVTSWATAACATNTSDDAKTPRTNRPRRSRKLMTCCITFVVGKRFSSRPSCQQQASRGGPLHRGPCRVGQCANRDRRPILAGHRCGG